ncbi:tandem-95 repeat protein, partial [Sulfurovum sp.]|uniref:Ig-like domain-containing protein n=1 Tax=Sulfurovum sp. TaxID=1969726 RepID=UPI0025F1545C
AVTNGAHGTVVINPDGTLTYTPAANWSGNDSFGYTVTSGGMTESATVNVTVNAVDDTTTVSGDTSGRGNEDTAITGTLLATDADGLSDGTVFSVTGNPAHGTASIDAASGAWSYTPTADYNGSDGFTVTITDDTGNTATQVITLVVDSVTDIQNDIQSTNEDTDDDFAEEETQNVTEPLVLTGNLDNGNNEVMQEEPDHENESVSINILEEVDLDSLDEVLNINEPTITISSNPIKPDTDMTPRSLFLEPINLDSQLMDVINENSQSDNFHADMEKMYRDIDQMAEKEQDKNTFVAEMATGVTLSLTAGFVAWLLRSGALLASFFTTMPMWRYFDPVPIISDSEDEEKPDPVNEAPKVSENIEDMFEKEK